MSNASSSDAAELAEKLSRMLISSEDGPHMLTVDIAQVALIDTVASSTDSNQARETFVNTYLEQESFRDLARAQIVKYTRRQQLRKADFLRGFVTKLDIVSLQVLLQRAADGGMRIEQAYESILDGTATREQRELFQWSILNVTAYLRLMCHLHVLYSRPPHQPDIDRSKRLRHEMQLCGISPADCEQIVELGEDEAAIAWRYPPGRAAPTTGGRSPAAGDRARVGGSPSQPQLVPAGRAASGQQPPAAATPSGMAARAGAAPSSAGVANPTPGRGGSGGGTVSAGNSPRRDQRRNLTRNCRIC